jgi:hypothetical protein
VIAAGFRDGGNAMGINSPGDYLVHNPAGSYATPSLQPTSQEAAQAKVVSTKPRRLSWKRLMPISFRRH